MSEAKTAYCKKCGKEVAFESRFKQAYVEQDGMAYTFRRKIAVCPHCSSELPYAPFDDAAAKTLDDAVKRGEGLVTRDQIMEFPRRYAIGKRPLSLLLGWGELTYTRLVDGRMPSKEHSDELRHFIEEPAAFARLLEQGRANGTITEMAFSRSYRAVSKIMEESPESSFAEFLVVDRICMLADGDITPRALNVLVYYVQGWGSAILDDSIFPELPTASADGPSYARIKGGYSYAKIQEASQHAKDAAERASDPDAAEAVGSLSEREERLVDAVYERYGRFSGQELARMACSEAPWRKARKRADVSDGDACSEPITLKSMRKFFSKHSDPIKLA